MRFFTFILDVFSKLTKFSANCHLANDWSCFVNHKLHYPSDSPAKMVLWHSSGLLSQRLGVQIPAEMGEFLSFKNYLCKWRHKTEVGVQIPAEMGEFFLILKRILVQTGKWQ